MMHQLDQVLDVMRVPAHGDPLRAVVTVDNQRAWRDVACDILVVGGGMGFSGKGSSKETK